MSATPKAPVGRFVWHELMTTDVPRSIAFYKNLLGWETSVMEMPGGPYTMFGVGESRVGGFWPIDPQQGIPPHWAPYVSVENVDRTAARAKELGGSVMVPPTDIPPDIGRFAVIADPQGAHIYIYTSQNPQAYQPLPQGPGNFCWYELNARDVEGVKSFYAELFGWTHAGMDMGEGGPYTVFSAQGQQVAGAMNIPQGQTYPPNWLVYLAVTDTDQTVARAKELGGTVVFGPQDIPNVGRFAVLIDPTGAAFGVIASPR